MQNTLLPLLWFVAIVALIPLALWLLKRTPMGQAAHGGAAMRAVGQLALAPNQRVVTVEVGSGEARRWLVLGVTAQSIQTLHVLPALGEPADATAGTAPMSASFAALFQRHMPPPAPRSPTPGASDA